MDHDHCVDTLVKQYLMSKGYTQAAAAMESQQQLPTSSSSTTADLAMYAVKSTDPSIYDAEYKSFRSFATASLDLVKGELFLVLFPIFVHCYVGLVRQGHSIEARQFWCTWESDHIDRFPDELRMLSMLTVPEQLKGNSEFLQANAFVQQVSKSRFSMRLSNFSYGLLMNYVMQNHLLLVASIMNDRITFDKMSDVPASLSTDGAGMLIDGGNIAAFGGSEALTLGSGSDVDPANGNGNHGAATAAASASSASSSFPLGAQREQRPLLANILVAPGKGPAGGVIDFREDPLYSEWLHRLVRPRVFLAGTAIGKPSSSSSSSNSSGGPTVSSLRRDDSDRNEHDKKKIARFHTTVSGATSGSSGSSSSSSVSAMGNPLDPSVIFSTVTNTHENMTCLHITRGVSQAVAGFKDSCVRVWRLDDENSGSSNSSSSNVGVSQPSSSVFGQFLPSGGVWQLKDVLPKAPSAATSSGSSSNSGRGAGPTVTSSSGMDVEGRAGSHHRSSGGRRHDSSLRSMVELWGHSKAVYAVCQNNDTSGRRPTPDGDGRLILSSSADETIRLWDTSVVQCVGKYDCGGLGLGPAWGVAFSPLGSGYYFASAHRGHVAAVFSTDRSGPLRLLTGHLSDVNAVTWHENATLVATCSDDRTARLFDIRSGKCARVFGGSPTALCSVALTAFSPSSGISSLIAAGNETGSVCLWDVGSGRRLAALGGHQGSVHSLSFSADGTALASGGADCSVRVYDVQACVTFANSYSVTSSTLTGAKGATTTAPTAVKPVASSSSSNVPGNLSHGLLQPRHSFFSKFSPVYYVCYTDKNLLYAGGPFSLRSAVAEATATEQETASLLGISQTVLGT